MAEHEVSAVVTEHLGTFLDRLQATVERVHQVGMEQHQRQLDRYLAEDGTPLLRPVKVPDPLAAGWQIIEVPLLALAPLTSMQIKELTLEFDAMVVSVGDQPDAGATFKRRETSVRLEKAPSSGGGPAMVRVVFEPSTDKAPHRSDVAIRFRDPGPAEPPAPPRPSPPPAPPPPRGDPMTDPTEDFVFTIEGATLVGEERIDPHEEEATVVFVVALEMQNSESMWELAEARLSLDVGGLPDSIAIDGGKPAENLMHFPLDPEELRGNGSVEVFATVKTGTFAVSGGPAAESGSHGFGARVEAFYVPVGGAVVGTADGEVTIEVAPD